jgi:hypothetical protein
VIAGQHVDPIRSVTRIRLRAVEEPLDRPSAAWEAVRFLSTAEVLVLLPASPESIETLDVRTVRAVLKEAAAAGVGRQALAEADSRDEADADAWVDVLVRANAVLADSPIPERTWPASPTFSVSICWPSSSVSHRRAHGGTLRATAPLQMLSRSGCIGSR